MPRALWAKAPFVLVRHRAVLLAVVVASFLVAMAASSAPLLRAGAESEALKGKLELLTPLGAGLTIENYRRPESAAGDRARRAAAVRFAHGLPYVQAPILTTTAFAQVGGRAALAGNPLYVIPMARTGATEHVHRMAGEGSDAWIPGSVATVADLAPGDTLHLLDGGPGVRPRSVSLPISAVYRGLEGDRDNPYWVNFTVRIRARTPDSPLPPAFVLVRQDELYRISEGLRNPYLENTFEFPVAPGALTPARARKIADAFAAARRALGRPTPLAKSMGCGMTQVTRCSVTGSIQAAVILARESVDALTPVILLLAAFAGLIAAGAAFIAGTFNVRRRSGEARLSVVLGERRASFAARAALEALLPTVVGAAGGLAMAALLVRMFTPDGTVDGGVVRSAVLAAIGAAAVAVAAVATGAWVARGRTIDRPSASHRLARVPWELPLLAAAVGSTQSSTAAAGSSMTQRPARTRGSSSCSSRCSSPRRSPASACAPCAGRSGHVHLAPMWST